MLYSNPTSGESLCAMIVRVVSRKNCVVGAMTAHPIVGVEMIEIRFEVDRLKPIRRVRRSAAAVDGMKDGTPW